VVGPQVTRENARDMDHAFMQRRSQIAVQ
jgi:hypothetical protein